MRWSTAKSRLAVVGGLALAVGAGQLPPAAVAPLAAGVPGVVEFTATGDFADSSNTSAVLTQVASIAPDFHIALGDLSYAGSTEEEWCDFVTSRVGEGFAFELLAGNHESDGMDGDINDFSACLPNQLPGLVGTYGRQWWVDVPRDNPLVRVVAISPSLSFPSGTWPYDVGSERYEWTADAIDGARDAGIPWVVAAMHKPCLSVGTYGCDVGEHILDLLLEKDVDLVLHGHEHSYMRTHQLGLGSGCSALEPGTFDSDCLVDSDSDFDKGAGTVFATVGTGGIALRDVNASDSEAPYFAAFSGLNANPTWGNLHVTATQDALTAEFVAASGGSFADAFTIATPDPGANQPPTAAFTTATTGLGVDVDAATSIDPDGTISTYDWDFGDGATDTGVTTSHTYTNGGTYDITLTVTDDQGATGTDTQSVTVTDPGGVTPIAQDLFERSVANGWGSADVGGSWSGTSGSSMSVSGGTGLMTLGSGSGLNAYLTDVAATSTDTHLTLTPDRGPTGSGLYTFVHGRRVGSASYRAKIRVYESGAVNLYLTHNASGGEAYLDAIRVPGLTIGAGDSLDVRLQVEGTSPTTLRARAWPTGDPEPSTWTVTASDSTASLQTAGHVGLSTYLSSGATDVPLTLLVDDFSVTAVD